MANLQTSGVALRYASALFDLAKDEGTLEAVETDLRAVGAMLDDSADLRRLVTSPVFSTEDQTRAMGAILKKAGITGLAANFVQLSAATRRLFALPAMIEAYLALMSEHRGETVAEITSAEPLSDSQVSALSTALAEKVSGTIKLETKVDPSLIGGLVVRLGSQMIDTSVKTRLQGLSAAMKEAV